MNSPVSSCNELVSFLSSEHFCKAVFSSRLRSGNGFRKVVFSPIGHGKVKIESFDSRRCTTAVVTYDELLPHVVRYSSLFKQVDLFLCDAACHVRLAVDPWEWAWSSQTTLLKSPLHNRAKKYLFPEGVFQPFLHALHIMDRQGNVQAKMRRKFVQVNTFLESIGDLLDHLRHNKKTIRVVDVGCGKGYLTFALAALLQDHLGVAAEVIGIDSREDVISHCSAVRDQLALSTLDFRMATIGSLDRSLSPDLLIALHACNTATDVALFKAVEWGTEAVAVAPCCQHELESMIHPSLFPMLFQYPIFAHKAAALLTDAFRCELLSACGYRVHAMEFTDPDHTPKNILLKAVKTGKKQPLRSEFHLVRQSLPSGILLERLLIEKGLLTL